MSAGWPRRPDLTGRTSRVIMLTARDAVDDRVRGLDEGADDYLAKPSRSASSDALGPGSRATRHRCRRCVVVERAGSRLDTGPQEVGVGQPVDLTAKEYALLRWFVLHPDEVHSAERLLEHVWDEHADPFSEHRARDHLRTCAASSRGAGTVTNPSRR